MATNTEVEQFKVSLRCLARQLLLCSNSPSKPRLQWYLEIAGSFGTVNLGPLDSDIAQLKLFLDEIDSREHEMDSRLVIIGRQARDLITAGISLKDIALNAPAFSNDWHPPLGAYLSSAMRYYLTDDEMTDLRRRGYSGLVAATHSGNVTVTTTNPSDYNIVASGTGGVTTTSKAAFAAAIQDPLTEQDKSMNPTTKVVRIKSGWVGQVLNNSNIIWESEPVNDENFVEIARKLGWSDDNIRDNDGDNGEVASQLAQAKINEVVAELFES